MTRRASPEPLRKITLDIFAEDVEYLKQMHGQGETARVIRALVRAHVINLRKLTPAPTPSIRILKNGEDI